MSGNLALVRGNVLTMDPDMPRATAILIEHGKVTFVGSDHDVLAMKRPGTEVVDLQGRAASPGLNDAHAHPMALGFARGDLDLTPTACSSIADIVSRVEEAIADRPFGAWIVGRGYDQGRLTDQRHPTRHDLDAISPDNPVLLIRACHHIAVANSKALELGGVDRNTPDPEGGSIDHDEAGEPTGVLRETAYETVRATMGQPTEDDMVDAIKRGGDAFLAAGVTSAVEAGIYRFDELRAYQRLWRSGELPIRTYLMMIIDETLDELIDLGIQTGFGDAHLRIGPAKLFSDGSIGGHTARMSQPYEGTTDGYGLWMQEPEMMKASIKRAHNAGFQVGIHAIGDAAINLILDGYEEAQTASPREDARHRIEHCSIVDLPTVERIAQLGVIPIPGTTFLYDFMDSYVNNLGMERLRYAYGMRTFADHGIVAAASTDAPVVNESAMLGLQTMTTRRDVHGRPIWEEERVTLDEALRAYTVNGAYASFEESTKGSLEPGKLGDVTVFETDIEAVAPAELGTVAIDLTILSGNVVFER